MYKKSFASLFTIALVAIVFPSLANTSENFNSKKGLPVTQIRERLQSICWTFHHFDVNHNGWNPGLEGDGAMVSGPNAIQYKNAGIYTPLLSVSSQLDVSFDYRFNEDFSSSASRWMKICLATATNEIVQVLEELHFNGFQAVKAKNYSTRFSNLTPGTYRLVLLYGGSGGSAAIAVDGLNTSAALRYEGGCSEAPIATKDKITGMPDRSARGSLLLNDMAPDKSSLRVFLSKPSIHGKVDLANDGSFVFTPNSDFKGKSTSFAYRICNDDAADLCSPVTTVNIHFPDKERKPLADFKGSYKMDGNVELVWYTTDPGNLDKFEIERCVDGRSWERTGIVPASRVITNRRNDYTYMDKVSRNTAHKRDLYYRLKQVQADGTVTTSRLMIVRVYNTKTLTMISITPNPASNDIAVNLQLVQDAYVSMKITSSAGETVIRKVMDVKRGIRNLHIEGSSALLPGAYLLEVIVNSKERMLVKLMKE